MVCRRAFNHFFYRTINFWLGLFLLISNLFDVVSDLSAIHFNFYLDLVGVLIGLILVVNGLSTQEDSVTDRRRFLEK